jgi:hypothetical protein
MTLTKLHEEYLRFIRDNSPSLKELAKHFGVSDNGSRSIVHEIRSRGAKILTVECGKEYVYEWRE